MGADDARKLFVGGLSDSVTEETLRDIFEGSGQVVAEVHVPRDRESGRPRGFAFVTFATPDAAETARRAVDGAVHGGRAISVRRFSQEGPRRMASERPARADDRTLFVGKLPYDATVEEVEGLFAAHEVTSVERVSLPTGPDGRPRGFGFVTIETAEAAALAVEKLSRAQLRGRQLVITPAQPRGKPGASGRDAEPAARSDRSGGGRFNSSVPRQRFEEAPYPHEDEGRAPSGGLDRGFEPPPPARVQEARVQEARVQEDGHGRRDEKKRKKEKKNRATDRATRRERGGARTWQRWQADDE